MKWPRNGPFLFQVNMEKQYLDLLKDVMENGLDKSDRTGVGTRSVFARSLRFDLSKGFPLLTTKKVHFKSVAIELLWFISGSTNIKFLQDNNVKIWNEWADKDGNLGPVYGQQWRDFGGKDQLQGIVDRIRTNPECRRLLVSAWNPPEISKMALPPCHYSFQFVVQGDKLNLLFNMRSTDCFLGLPFNIASYALLCHMVAHLSGLKAGELVYNGGDVHIYKNHFDAVNEQISRDIKTLPTLELVNPPSTLDGWSYENFAIKGYNPHPAIKAPVAV